MEIRICKECGEEKGIEDFSISGKYKGIQYKRRVCTFCRCDYYKKYYQQNKEKRDLYNQVNRERINTVRRKYYQRNCKKIIERSRIYIKQNRERISELQAKRYIENGERGKRIEACHNLSDSYICLLLGGGPNFPKVLIETKKLQIQILREIKQLQI